MALGFGHLYKLHGIVMYRISPMHQKAFYGALRHGIPNTFRRCIDQAPYVLPPFLLCAGAYYGGDYMHQQSLRKKPGEYDCDE